MCDSRVYEYLIPTHCLLPPHPSSFLGKKLAQLAEEAEDLEGYMERQEEVSKFWEEVESEKILPILETLDTTTREIVENALYAPEKTVIDEMAQGAEGDTPRNSEPSQPPPAPDKAVSDIAYPDNPSPETLNPTIPSRDTLEPLIKTLRTTYISSKRAFRLPPSRLARITHALFLFTGTHNYHNYTIQKTFRDPSSMRIIKSFSCNPTPTLFDDTEWLSLKVHGQSFMMHQIRKMVGMAAMAVRCGTDIEKVIKGSYGKEKLSIPKAPGLGLLLEKPVFETWNKKAAKEFGREGIDFTKFEEEIETFKQKEIYERIFREEEKFNTCVPLFFSTGAEW
jgi:tRNA pseudouridine38-40 synthase